MTLRDENSRIPWLSLAATILVAAVLLVVFRPGLEKWIDLSAARPSAGTALSAGTVGDAVEIRWQPRSNVSALSIKDGDAWHTIALDHNALAEGRYSYRASSSEVLIRMNGETVRVMGLTPSAPVVEVAHEQAAPEPVEQTADRAVASSPEIAEHRIVPTALPQALRGIRGTVRVDVRVAIGADGSVQSAQVVTRAQSPYFNRLSQAAAQGSRFKPSRTGGSVVLRYEYSRGGVEVSQRTP